MGAHLMGPSSGLFMKEPGLIEVPGNLMGTEFHVPAINPLERLRALEDHDSLIKSAQHADDQHLGCQFSHFQANPFLANEGQSRHGASQHELDGEASEFGAGEPYWRSYF